MSVSSPLQEERQYFTQKSEGSQYLQMGKVKTQSMYVRNTRPKAKAHCAHPLFEHG